MRTDSHSAAEKDELNHKAARLAELNNTSTQVLIFLSFAIVAAVTFLSPTLGPSPRGAVVWALRWWIGAIFPTVIGIIPLKEIRNDSVPWYTFILWMRQLLLWCAIICIFIGAVQFLKAI